MRATSAADHSPVSRAWTARVGEQLCLAGGQDALPVAAHALGVRHPEQDLARVDLRPPLPQEGLDLEVVLELVEELVAVTLAVRGPGGLGQGPGDGRGGRGCAGGCAAPAARIRSRTGESSRTAWPATKARNCVGRVRGGVAGGPRQDAADPQRPLHRSNGRRVEAHGRDAVDDVAERAQRHRLLAQRGQHPLDVCRVGRRGARRRGCRRTRTGAGRSRGGRRRGAGRRRSCRCRVRR